MAESKVVLMLQRHESLRKSQSLNQESQLKDQAESQSSTHTEHVTDDVTDDEVTDVTDSKAPVRSHGSMLQPPLFRDGPPSTSTNNRTEEAEFVERSSKQGDATGTTETTETTEITLTAEATCASVLARLETELLRFVQTELRKFQKVLTLYPDLAEDEDETEVSDAFLTIALSFLKSMKEDKMADALQNRQTVRKCSNDLKSLMRRRFHQVSEGVAMGGSAPLSQIYTELYITESGVTAVNQEHEIRVIETHGSIRDQTPLSINKLFEERLQGGQGALTKQRSQGQLGLLQEREEPKQTRAVGLVNRDTGDVTSMDTGGVASVRPIRTLLTVGVAGVGKSVLTQKLALDWAEGQALRGVHMMFLWSFREINVLKDLRLSLEELLHRCCSQIKVLRNISDLQLLLVLDGLDEFRLSLDFAKTPVLTRSTDRASVEELLVNIIRGDLLPFAQIWITSRPTAASQIPQELVSMVTEVRGFSDLQKEQYFRSRFTKTEQEKIISYIRSIRSLFIMCSIPVFCWITSTVLENLLKSSEEPQLPHTLTNLYIHLLMVLLKQKNFKYDGKPVTAPVWTSQNKQMVLALGRLAFEQLQEGNLIFSESNLRECGLEKALHSGLLTQVFIEEPGLYQDQAFSFIHLSLQEFLAALHVHQTFIHTGVNLLEPRAVLRLRQLHTDALLCSAVDQALHSPHGQLDLLLRFLLGLSVEENQSLLKGLLLKADGFSSKTVAFIKQRLDQGHSPPRSLNLLYALQELKDQSLVQQIQTWTRGDHICEESMSPSLWGTLSFIILSSQSDLQHFDLRSFCSSETALLGLLPVLRASTSATISSCGLTPLCAPPLALVISSSTLTHLDLSNNNLGDSGVKSLCEGLRSATCRLHFLSLSGCMVTDEGCDHLSSALTSNPSPLLTHLDLSYNHIGEKGVELQRCLMEHQCPLQSLRLDPQGAQWLKPGLTKYWRALTWDLASVHPRLRFSDRRTAVMYVNDEQNYPESPQRFDWFYQVLCDEELTGRCYFQVQWSGVVQVGVAYRALQRKGRGLDSLLGGNAASWCLSCSDRGFSVCHRNKETALKLRRRERSIRAVAVFVDFDGGEVSFFSVSDHLMLLHSFRADFSEPLVAAFSFRFDSMGSTIVMCPAQEHSNNQSNHL